MKYGEFVTGMAFMCGDKRWRCTDVGTRVIVAVCLDNIHIEDTSWYSGPPYTVAELVFDENDTEACEPVSTIQ
jgi:hypothetical protein